MRGNRGFTYIELTLVLTIVAILAAIAVPNFLEAQVRGKVSRARAELAVLKMAVEAYRMETKSYPLNKVRGVPSPYDLVSLTTPVPYIGTLPADLFLTAALNLDKPHSVPPAPYSYLNAVQVDREKGLQVQEPHFWAHNGFIAALLWGRGPALQSSTSISKTEEASLLFYDPTNGTTSPGDIYVRMP